MNFIRELGLSLLKSIILFGVTTIAIMSLLQQKFPPSFTKAKDDYQKYVGLVSTMAKFNPQATINDLSDATNPEETRARLLEEVAKIDPSMSDLAGMAKSMDLSGQEKKTVKTKKAEDPIDFSKPNDVRFLKLRLEQSEYKIRVLEYEMGILKAELKKIKPIEPKVTN